MQPDEGELLLDGTPVRLHDPLDAQARGIVCVFQELSLIPDLSVADNIGLVSPPRRFGLIDNRAQRRRAEELLARVGVEGIDPRARVRDLPLSRRQMVEIAKALGRDPKLLILDEATSALTSEDVGRLSDLLLRLRAEGMCILYISHRMHEIRCTRRHLLGVHQRPPCRELRHPCTWRGRDRAHDDRPRGEPGVPAQAARSTPSRARRS